MTGFGRTGKHFAYQHAPGVTPDLMVLGKGMVSAALPAGGVVISREIAEVMDRYRWETVSTFAGNPIVSAAIAANVEWLLEERIADRAAVLGAHLGQRLRELQDRHPTVAGVDGAGLLWAVELVRPDGSGERFVPADRHLVPSGPAGFSPSLFVAAECARHGVALATAPPNTLRLGPPLSTTVENIDSRHRRAGRGLHRARPARSPGGFVSATVDRDSVRGLLLHLLAQVPDDAPSLRDRPIQGAPLLAIGGELVPAASGASFPVLNPATGEVIGDAADADLADLDRALASAREAFDTTSWSRDHALRASCLRQLQAALADERETLRRDLVAEIGCAVRMTYGDQLDRPIEKLGFYADLAESYPYDTAVAEREGNWFFREPIGVVSVITPWNIPVELNLAKVGAALAAGCTVVLKPSPLSPWSGAHLGRLVVERTDFPKASSTCSRRRRTTSRRH